MISRANEASYSAGYLGALVVIGLHLSLLIAIVLGTSLALIEGTGGVWYTEAGLSQFVVAFLPVAALGLAVAALVAVRRSYMPILVPIGSGILIVLIGLTYSFVDRIGPLFLLEPRVLPVLDPYSTILVILTIGGGLSIVASAVGSDRDWSTWEMKHRFAWPDKIPLVVLILGLVGLLFLPVYHLAAVAWILLTWGVFVTIGILITLQLWRVSRAESPWKSLYALEALGAMVVLCSIAGVITGGVYCTLRGAPEPSIFEMHARYSMYPHRLSFHGCRTTIHLELLFVGSALLITKPVVDILQNIRREE